MNEFWKRGSYSRRQWLGGAAAGLVGVGCFGQTDAPAGPPEHVRVGDSDVDVTFRGSSTDLDRAELLGWVQQCATAVGKYFGRFPVPRARLQIVSRPGRQGVSGGRTW